MISLLCGLTSTHSSLWIWRRRRRPPWCRCAHVLQRSLLQGNHPGIPVHHSPGAQAVQIQYMSQGNDCIFFLEMCSLGCTLSNHRICEAAKTNGLLEQELAHAVNAASHAINKTHPKFPEVSY